MKTSVDISLLVLIITLISCNNSVDSNQYDLAILIETAHDIRELNVSSLNQAKQTILEKGNRPADIEKLDDIRKAISIRKSYELDFDLNELTKTQTITDVKPQLLMDFVSTFSEEYEQLNYNQNNIKKTDDLMLMAQQYVENNSLLNLLLLDLQILALERDLLGTLNSSLGGTETFGFDYNIFVYPQVDQPKSSEPFTAILSLNSEIVGNEINLSQPEILINDKKNIPHKLEPFNTGLWLFTFTPELSGAYNIKFKTLFTPELYLSEQYAFNGEYEVIVK